MRTLADQLMESVHNSDAVLARLAENIADVIQVNKRYDAISEAFHGSFIFV